jgi:hypothetical protein
VDVVKGRIIDYDERTGEVTIKASYSDLYTMLKRGYRECNIQMIDSRPLSEKQRKCCYSLIRAISDYTGMGEHAVKEWAKIKFITEDLQETADMMFSLSNAPMSLVCAFQRWLVRVIVEEGIPCSFSLLDYVDDVEDYVYACAIKKVCAVCGRPADLHHVDAVGMGNDRDEIDHLGMHVLPLCRDHHIEAHKVGKYTFRDKYHLTDGVVLDRALCRLYGLKYKKDKKEPGGN